MSASNSLQQQRKEKEMEQERSCQSPRPISAQWNPTGSHSLAEAAEQS